MNEETITKKEKDDSDVAFAEGKETETLKPHETRKLIMRLLAAAAVMLALAVGIGIYNAPTNRLHRHLELANKYLLEMKYDQAIVEFDKVIAIDPMSVEAYLGKAEAYVGLDDYDQAAEILEAGYLATQEDIAVKDRLIAVYIEILDDSSTQRSFEEKLEIYDRLIELEADSREVLIDLEKCLEQYINVLLEEGKNDKIRALIEKYKDILSGTDFDTFILQIEFRIREMGYGSLLNEAQKLILAENYEQLNVLVQKQEYQDMIASLKDDESYYLGERDSAGRRSGKGIAVYKGYYGEYFYYGLWREDERSGYGQAIRPTPDDSAVPYKIFMGEWANDLPNGKGEERRHVIQSEIEAGRFEYSLYQGSYKDGLYDGEIYMELIDSDGMEYYEGMANNGVWEPQGIKSNGDVIISEIVEDSSTTRTLSCPLEGNKNQGVTWLLPSTYWGD